MHVLHAFHALWHLSTLSGESWNWSWISGLNHNYNSLIIISEILAPKFGSTNSNSSEILIKIQISLQVCVTLRLYIEALCVHFLTLIIWEIRLQSLDLILPFFSLQFCSPSLPPFIFSYLQAFIHGFLWWWACSWLIFSLKWRLQSPFLLLFFVSIDLQEVKDPINEEDPRPTSSTWSHISVSFKCRPIVTNTHYLGCEAESLSM